jgi:hypothetical protein
MCKLEARSRGNPYAVTMEPPARLTRSEPDAWAGWALKIPAGDEIQGLQAADISATFNPFPLWPFRRGFLAFGLSANQRRREKSLGLPANQEGRD